MVTEITRPKAHAVRGALLPMELNAVGNSRRNYRRIKTKGGSFENFGAHFILFPVGITDGTLIVVGITDGTLIDNN
jgi:hypothetical protein